MNGTAILDTRKVAPVLWPDGTGIQRVHAHGAIDEVGDHTHREVDRVTKSTLCRQLDEESPLGLLDKRFSYPISHRVANRERQTKMVVVGEFPNLNLRA